MNMYFLRIKSKYLLIVLITIISVSCVSTRPAREPRQYAEIISSQDSITFKFHPFFNIKDCKEVFGYDPKETFVFPIYLTIENNSSKIIKIDFDKSYLMINEQKQPIINSVTAKFFISVQTRKSGSSLISGPNGNIFVYDNQTNNMRNFEEGFQAGIFNPSLLNSKATGRGSIYSQFPKQEKLNSAKLNIYYNDLSSNNESTIEISIPDSLLNTNPRVQK